MASLNTEKKKLEAGPYRSALAPEIYEERNAHANHEPRLILQIFGMAFTTPSDESQQFVDIGCGTGDFTRDWILPSCEPCKRDLHRSLGNIAQLLAPGGECLLVFLGRSFLFESFKEISRLQPWSKYADVLLQAVPKSHDIVDQKGQRDYLSSALSSAGLVPYTSEVLMHTRPGDAITSVARTANPIYSLLSEEDKTAFQEMVSTHESEWHDLYCKTGGPILWSSFLVHARKP
ncbi:hypothetical protein MTO96_016057 [Rhipicephalus appendiculatus]